MGLILISDVFTFYMLIASIHALKHLGHRVAPARIFHVAEGGDPRLYLPFRSGTVSYSFDYYEEGSGPCRVGGVLSHPCFV